MANICLWWARVRGGFSGRRTQTCTVAQSRHLGDDQGLLGGLRRVIYEPWEQHNIIRAVIAGIADLVNRFPEKEPRLWLRLNMLLSQFRTFLKHHSFHEEKELRAIVLVPKGDNRIKQRRSADGTSVPYVEITFPERIIPGQLPVAEIVRGPKSALGQVELTELTRKCGFPGVEITRSFAPLR